VRRRVNPHQKDMSFVISNGFNKSPYCLTPLYPERTWGIYAQNQEVAMFKDLIDDFNKFFKGKAKAIVVNGGLEITIGSKTAIISLPEVPRIVGGRNNPTA
jgi:hypothetical protein